MNSDKTTDLTAANDYKDLVAIYKNCDSDK